MLRRYIVPSLIALTMILGATSASSTEVTSEPLAGQAADAMIVEQNGAGAATTLGLSGIYAAGPVRFCDLWDRPPCVP